ncbi:MAG: rod shape-determining protein [Sarcina sp.]
MSLFKHSHLISIDLGSNNTLIYINGEGIVLNEPSVIAINAKTKKILAFGKDAKQMIGRTSKDIIVCKPLKHGVISNFDLAKALVTALIHKAIPKDTLRSYKAVVSYPSEITDIEKIALEDCIRVSNINEVIFIEEPFAASIGADLPINEPVGSMIVDIGGGTTDIAVISLSGIVTSKSINFGSNDFDTSIINFMQKENDLLIGEITAENIKINLGSAIKLNDSDEVGEARGIDLISGLPKICTVTESQIRKVIEEPLLIIIATIKYLLEHTPPELRCDIKRDGLTLSGGGSLLKGIDKFISTKLNIPVHLAPSPLESVAIGSGKYLSLLEKKKKHSHKKEKKD